MGEGRRGKGRNKSRTGRTGRERKSKGEGKGRYGRQKEREGS